MSLLIALMMVTTTFIVVSFRALADSVSEFDFWWEDDMYDE